MNKLPDLNDPVEAVAVLSTAFTQLLDLPEAPNWRFKVSSQGADIDLKPVDLLTGWLSGQSLPALADTHLAAATKPAWRIEQMVGAITEHFEHYLAWTIGALVEIVNNRLADGDSETRLCPELSGYIRYGVDTPHALLLMTSGMRSRRLAHAVVADLPRDLEPLHEDLRAWLAGMGIAEWRERYYASSSEVLDLLDFTRLRSRSLLKTLLETGSVTVTLSVEAGILSDSMNNLSLEPMRGERAPEPLAVYADDEPVAIIASQDHADLRAILDTGLDLDFYIDTWTDPPALRITLPLGESEA